MPQPTNSKQPLLPMFAYVNHKGLTVGQGGQRAPRWPNKQAAYQHHRHLFIKYWTGEKHPFFGLATPSISIRISMFFWLLGTLKSSTAVCKRSKAEVSCDVYFCLFFSNMRALMCCILPPAILFCQKRKLPTAKRVTRTSKMPPITPLQTTGTMMVPTMPSCRPRQSPPWLPKSPPPRRQWARARPMRCHPLHQTHRSLQLLPWDDRPFHACLLHQWHTGLCQLVNPCKRDDDAWRIWCAIGYRRPIFHVPLRDLHKVLQ